MHILIFNMHIQCIINAYAPFSTLWISHFQWTYTNQNYILEPSEGKVHPDKKFPKLINFFFFKYIFPYFVVCHYKAENGNYFLIFYFSKSSLLLVQLNLKLFLIKLIRESLIKILDLFSNNL